MTVGLARAAAVRARGPTRSFREFASLSYAVVVHDTHTLQSGRTLTTLWAMAVIAEVMAPCSSQGQQDIGAD